MADQPRPDNKAKAVRIPDGLWAALGAYAAARGTDRSKLLNAYAVALVDGTGLYVIAKPENVERLGRMGENPAEVLRVLASEALTAREKTCHARGHRGPVVSGACGHCGKETG